MKGKEYFKTVYKKAVNLCVDLCNEYKISVDKIVCHSEAYKLGYASNHADVMHWFPKHGKSMDVFRQDVKKGIEATKTVKPKVTLYTVKDMPNSPKYDAWVAELQRATGSADDGRYGKNTLSKCPKVVLGDIGTIIELLKERLKSLGYYKGTINKKYDVTLKKAVVAYEKRLGFSDTTGTINKAGKTWSALLQGVK